MISLNRYWEGIFTLDGEGWKHSRSMLRPQFAREQIAHVKSIRTTFSIIEETYH